MNKRELRRYILDKAIEQIIRLGGLSIVIFLILVFIYLVRQVIPLFSPAEIQLLGEQNIPSEQRLIHLNMEKQNEILTKFYRDGTVLFYDINRRLVVDEQRLTSQPILSYGIDTPTRRIIALSERAGEVSLVQHNYKEDFSSGVIQVKPELSFPYGREAIPLSQAPLIKIALLSDENSLTLIGLDSNGILKGKKLSRQVNFLSGVITREEKDLQLPPIEQSVDFIKIFNKQTALIIASRSGKAQLIDLRKGSIEQTLSLTQNSKITAIGSLTGELSLIVADTNGDLNQWFIPQASERKANLILARSFHTPSPAQRLVQVENSKSFIAITQTGNLHFFNAPAQRESINYPLSQTSNDIIALALSPRANGLVVIERNGLHKIYAVDNPYPDISLHRLFAPILYEGYAKKDFVWQSTAASDDFEPKYSLVPISFGTLKAAFYAMLFSAPLAVAAAIFTSFFMGPGLRRRVKPVIEMMEAFPTVILGFIAGLVMAPFFEKHLPGIFTIMILLPISVIILGFLFTSLPSSIRRFLTNGWEGILLIPVVLLIGYLLLELSPYLELVFFDGDMRVWLSDRGIDYNQRNALVVGIAMGLAVIPTIYSISEDALFAVPSSMVQGAYALGATPLQNVIGVVLPASMSGILSALMIGLGRAVGETMIVLMATGNTPVMDPSLFTGLRTLAANIAVEIPESPVGSSHFRVLFLCGLVLFGFTFIVNSIAEIIRHRIRKRYAHV